MTVSSPSGKRPRPALIEGLAARLLDAVEQAVVATDTSGTVVFWNRHAEQLTGWTSAELLGRPVLSTRPPLLDDKQLAALVDALRDGAARRDGLEVCRKDGSTFVAELVVSPLPYGAQIVGSVGVFADVTGRRQVEEAWQRSERRLRALFDSIDEGYCLCEMVVDEAGDPVDYRFLEVNPLFEQMTGLADPAGRTALELVPDLEQVWVQTYARVGLDRQTLRFEQGSASMGRWFDVFALPVEPHGHFALVFKDQTDRRRTVEALRESEERFRAMANQLPLAVWVHGPDGAQEWVNDTFCTVFGVSRDEMREDRWQLLTHPEDSAYTTEFAAAVAEQRPFTAEARVKRADGRWGWFASWGQPRFSVDGTYLGHLGTSADITDRKLAEAALRAAAAADAFRSRLVDALRSCTDPVEVQQVAARVLGKHFGAFRAHYAEIDESGEYGIVRTDYHQGIGSVVGRHRLDDHGPALMDEFRTGRTVVVTDVATDLRLTEAQRRATAALGIAAYVMVPLIKRDRTVATLVVHHEEAHRWSADELAIVNETAERTWAAVERAKTEQALRIRHERTELVAEFLGALENQPTFEGQLQRLAELLVSRVADLAMVEATERGRSQAGAAHRDNRRLAALRAFQQRRRAAQAADPLALAASGLPQLVDLAVGGEAAETPPGVHSLMAVPLELGSGVDGAILIGLVDQQRRPYALSDLDFFRDLAQRVSVVLAAARLRQEEHDISVRLQQALLPDTLNWHPNVVVEARYQAASAVLEVGGDWYDTFTWSDGKLGIMVGDVVGHNLDSAATMGRLRAATGALAGRLEPSPAALMRALEHFARGPDGTDFATAVCAVVDTETGRLTYSSAGHPPVIVVPPDGHPIRLRSARDLPLCAFPLAERTEATIDLEPGSLVVMYSDGLVERRGAALDDGIRRLERLVVGLARRPIADIADQVIARMAEHSSPQDDVVVACFRYAPVVDRLRRSIPADPHRLAGLRADLRGWLARHSINGRLRSDVLLCVGEACTNAIEHAYHGTSPGPVDVELTHHRYHLTVRVCDRGRWRHPGLHNRRGGRGTPIMRTVASNVSRISDTTGTVVTMTLPVPEPTPAPARQEANQ